MSQVPVGNALLSLRLNICETFTPFGEWLVAFNISTS